MRFTANFPREVIETGFPMEPISENDWLISIIDPGDPQIKPANKFNRVFSFEFDDCDPFPFCNCNEQPMQEWQAMEMARIIREASHLNKNLWVHCTAGICRSGAVVEILKLLGWRSVNEFSPKRLPNIHVFRSLRLQFDELKDNWELDEKAGEAWKSVPIITGE